MPFITSSTMLEGPSPLFSFQQYSDLLWLYIPALGKEKAQLPSSVSKSLNILRDTTEICPRTGKKEKSLSQPRQDPHCHHRGKRTLPQPSLAGPFSCPARRARRLTALRKVSRVAGRAIRATRRSTPVAARRRRPRPLHGPRAPHAPITTPRDRRRRRRCAARRRRARACLHIRARSQKTRQHRVVLPVHHGIIRAHAVVIVVAHSIVGTRGAGCVVAGDFDARDRDKVVAVLLDVGAVPVDGAAGPGDGAGGVGAGAAGPE